MEIYVVQQGDTLELIAARFGISVERLIVDNGIRPPYQLVAGQTLVIAHPLETYIVQEGDTLGEIAEKLQVDLMEILRNNPFLAEREYIYPGETLVIRYDTSKGDLYIIGYTYPFVRETILKKALPFLASLIIFNYQLTNDGELVGSDMDIELIKAANLYGAVATMVITTFTRSGGSNLAVEYDILLNPQLQEKIIDDVLIILKEKGYSGVNLAFQFVNVNNQQLYLDLLARVRAKLQPEGYTVFLTINPGVKYQGNEFTFERLNYGEFAANSDGILILSYDWASIYRPPIQYPITLITSFLDYLVAQVPLNKIRMGLATIGYDWPLPYIEGVTRARSLNFESVMELARQTNATIQYDEVSQSAYFEYVTNEGINHIVWFKDARSIAFSLDLFQSYGITRIGIWNILCYFAQMWTVISSQYQITKTRE